MYKFILIIQITVSMQERVIFNIHFVPLDRLSKNREEEEEEENEQH